MAKNIQKTGNWKKVITLVRSLDNELEAAQKKSLLRWGLKAEGVAKTHISLQDLNWVPLNPEYLNRKIKEGFSDNILVRSSSYFQSITSFVAKNTAYAGVKKSKLDENGVEIANIARVHEFGHKDSGIPARPLWQPTFKEVIVWHTKFNNPGLYFLEQIKRKYGV